MEITFFGESLDKYSNQAIQISSVFLQECDHKSEQIEQVRLNVERLGTVCEYEIINVMPLLGN